MTFTAPSSGASGLFGASLTKTAVTNASGVATATAFTANGTVGSYIVSARYWGRHHGKLQHDQHNSRRIAVNSVDPQTTLVNTAFAALLSESRRCDERRGCRRNSLLYRAVVRCIGVVRASLTKRP